MKRLLFVVCLFPAVLWSLPQSEIEDQFRNVHTLQGLFEAKPFVVIAGDQRKTGDYIKEWHARLTDLYPVGVTIIGLADLHAVPFFVPKGAVRRSLAGDFPDAIVLCDWKGEVYSAMSFKKDSLTVRVYDAEQKVLGEVLGQYSSARLGQVQSLIDAE